MIGMNSHLRTQASTSVLDISQLSMAVVQDGLVVPLLDRVSVSIAQGETVGLVGESGSGKSLTARTALGILPKNARTSGQVTVDGLDTLAAPPKALQQLRRSKASMVFQDPRASINPVRRIQDYLTEGLRARGLAGREARQEALDLLRRVGIQDAEGALRRYPHQFSGGMLQRVVIAGALSIEPVLLLADEPTTALDVTTQAEVVSLLKKLQQDRHTGMLFVTHDLELAAAICDRIYVMYAGRIVEHATRSDLFQRPAHPYTRALLNASPSVHGEKVTLTPVPGRPKSLADAPTGCSFRDRCPLAVDTCATQTPSLREHGAAQVACLRPEKVTL